jgi:hypothetical protein
MSTATLRDQIQAVLDRLPEERTGALADELVAALAAQLPPDGQGCWRQGTKNPRNLYVHQGDDEVGRPVGQLYSAELAALVCDAVNAQQARGGDLPAVREFVVNLDPRHVERPPTIKEILDHAASLVARKRN